MQAVGEQLTSFLYFDESKTARGTSQLREF